MWTAASVSVVKVDTGVFASTFAEIGVRARELEDLGYDGLMTAETAHDPFLPLAIAAEHTERVELATGIVVAFARTPMLTAYTAAWAMPRSVIARMIPARHVRDPFDRHVGGPDTSTIGRLIPLSESDFECPKESHVPFRPLARPHYRRPRAL